MQLDLSSLDDFFRRLVWPVTIGCRYCFPHVDTGLCASPADAKIWIQEHADLAHEDVGMDLLIIPPFRELPLDFFGPHVGFTL